MFHSRTDIIRWILGRRICSALVIYRILGLFEWFLCVYTKGWGLREKESDVYRGGEMRNFIARTYIHGCRARELYIYVS